MNKRNQKHERQPIIAKQCFFIATSKDF